MPSIGVIILNWPADLDPEEVLMPEDIPEHTTRTKERHLSTLDAQANA
jgi:hypothetical protein